jgi:PAS domain S-box-containing protein
MNCPLAKEKAMDKFQEALKIEPQDIAEELKTFNDEFPESEDVGDTALVGTLDYDDLAALYDINQAVNSTLILDDILDIVMTKSVNLFNAERGFLMLLDENNRLQFKTAHNIKKEQFNSEDMRISTTIADTVVKTGKSVYTSDALNDQRFAQKASIIDLHIRSAMVVPLKIKTEIIGVLYLDNSSQTNIFIKQDLVLFEMFAAQAALAIHNARLYSEVLELQKYQQNIIANIPIGLLVVDTGANITAVNGSIQKIFDKIGWHQFSNNLIGKKIIDCVPDKYRRTFIESLAADKNQPVIIPRFNIDCQDKEIVLKLHFCPFDNYHGDKSGHIILFEDITEQVILEQYLILSEKLIGKGEMAAAIGHELNNYLTVISTNAQLVAMNLDQGKYDNLKGKVDVIVKNVDHIKRFTDGLMDFSTLELKPVPYDLSRLVEDLVFFVKPQPKFKHVTFDIDVPSNLPQVHIDVGQIHQVLLNLIINSADAFAESRDGKGHIRVKAAVYEKGNMIALTVADNGPGIADEVFGKLFEPHITTKKTGHGLGLSNCLRIVNNHGGKIKAFNLPEGGACFEILLPIAIVSK